MTTINNLSRPFFPFIKNRALALNRAEYGESYGQLPWVTADSVATAVAQREKRLLELNGAGLTHAGSKPFTGELSPSCASCGEGTWSCLFINGQCNCRCFFCPARQEEAHVPMTNSVDFASPVDYADYVRQFDFRGVSISGGEPLLTLDATLSYGRAVKQARGERTYLWLYTNGTLLNARITGQLADIGLDEIRFDIAATGYCLDKVRLATGKIPCVTVEIPAIPEDMELLKGLLPELSAAGVSYLNLHQLRLTPHNFQHLVKKDYTFLHGEKVTVLESELAALELLAHAHREQLPLSINYCSFVYKNRFQKAAARRRSAVRVIKPFEDLTDNGYIRSLFVSGHSEHILALAERLRQSSIPAESWSLGPARQKLFFSSACWDAIPRDVFSLSVAYHEARILPALSYRNPFLEVPLNDKRSVFIERSPASETLTINTADIQLLDNLIKTKNLPPFQAEGHWPDIVRLELIPEGLQDYY